MPDQIISQFSRIYALPIETNRQVSSAAARDAIPSGVRWEGMLVYVVSDSVTYELRGGITNTDWTAAATGLADAPNDGNEYVRKNAAWSLASSGIIEAPIDGTSYVRKNGIWTAETIAAGGVDTFNGRSGVVVPLTTDYSAFYADISHTHTIANVTSLQASLDGKASTSHSHTIANVTGLQTELDGKALTGHSHIIGDVTGLQTELNGKALTSHSHIIGDTTGLQTALDGKALTGHTHTIADITDFDTTSGGGTAVLEGAGGGSWALTSILATDYEYRTVGDIVFIQVAVVLGAKTGTPSGALRLLLNSFPASASLTGLDAVPATMLLVDLTNSTTTPSSIEANISGSGVILFNYRGGSGASVSSALQADNSITSGQIRLSFMYIKK